MSESARAGEQASAARRVQSNRFGALSSDDEDDESDEDGALRALLHGGKGDLHLRRTPKPEAGPR